MPEGGERRRNLTTTGLGEKTRPRVKRDRGATQSPLRIRSSVLVQVEALVKVVVTNHNDHEGCRSEAPPGNVVHQGDMEPEGEAQPDSPVQLVLLEVQKGQKITCGSVLANVSKITLDLPWRPARAGWQEEI